MRDYQKELHAVRERIAQHRENLRVLEQLQQQETECQEYLRTCEWEWHEEQRDVERLERLSWSSIWAVAKGSKEEDLDREKAEAWAARVKLQEAQRQMEEIQREIAERQSRADDGCEAVYQELLREKEMDYRQTNPAFAAKMANIEGRELEMVTQRKELNEALYAGKRVLTQIHAALDKLSSAQGWSTWDLMGGGLVADMMKYSNMDEAQHLIECVQSDLRRYRAELADVAQTANFNLQTDAFTWAMDIWFDNIFGDWAVRDRIVQSGRQLEDVEYSIRSMQERLEEQLRGVQHAMELLQQEREETVRQA